MGYCLIAPSKYQLITDGKNEFMKALANIKEGVKLFYSLRMFIFHSKIRDEN